MIITTKHYNLEIQNQASKVIITMKLADGEVDTTGYFPKTTDILKEQIPSVLLTRCFNDAGLTFDQEVKMTELGHLFEHILIDKMCLEKAKMEGEVTISGVTSWDWHAYGRGCFHIEIQANDTDQELLNQALPFTMNVIDSILES